MDKRILLRALIVLEFNLRILEFNFFVLLIFEVSFSMAIW